MTAQPQKNDRTVYNLSDALKIARERFSAADIAQQCRKSGALCSPGIVTLNYLNEIYRIDILSAEVAFVDSKSPVPQRDKILILHYFTQAQGTPLTGKQIPFRDLPGGLVYYPTFIKRTMEPLADFFGKEPALLGGVGKMLGARKGEVGDASLIIDAFTRVPVNIILWQGDDELKAEVNLLFDANIPDYLTSEDITILCETITWRLINYAKKV
jgi:Domain of unknown function (DUF3786)